MKFFGSIFRSQDASLTVIDKRINLTWRQKVKPGFKVDPGTLRVTANSISGRVSGAGETYDLTIELKGGKAAGFDLTAKPNERYGKLPPYPFHFIAPDKSWSYVQNTSGEGMLMPLDRPGDINKPYGWGGSQPWWGLTDLERGMAVRLDTFRNPDTRSGPEDATVYAFPLRLRYDFITTGGYVALAQLYRDYFLAAHPEMQPLRERVARRPPVGMLKDGVYVYFWGENPADDLKLVTEMKAAGIDRGFAVFYGKRPIDRALFDGIKKLGWVPGSYRMPTGNLFRVGRRGWPNAILTGRMSEPRNSSGKAIPKDGSAFVRSSNCRAGWRKRKKRSRTMAHSSFTSTLSLSSWPRVSVRSIPPPSKKTWPPA